MPKSHINPSSPIRVSFALILTAWSRQFRVNIGREGAYRLTHLFGKVCDQCASENLLLPYYRRVNGCHYVAYRSVDARSFYGQGSTRGCNGDNVSSTSPAPKIALALPEMNERV